MSGNCNVWGQILRAEVNRQGQAARWRSIGASVQSVEVVARAAGKRLEARVVRYPEATTAPRPATVPTLEIRWEP